MAKVTKFNLDPKGLEEMKLHGLQMLVLELVHDLKAVPDTKEACIALLSKDYRGK